MWLENESANRALMNATRVAKSGAVYFEVLGDDESIRLTACLNPDDQVLISSGSTDSAKQVATYIAQQGMRIPGLFASNPISIKFAEAYSDLSNLKYKRVKQLGHYELYEFRNVAKPKYTFEQPSAIDLDLLIEYREMSQREENIQRPSSNLAESIQKELEAESIFVLKDEGAIQCIGSVFDNRSKRSGYITGIYTPQDKRGRGFATAMTFELATRLRNQGLIPTLSVDVVNHPAIRAYEKVGFKLRCKMDNIRFD